MNARELLEMLQDHLEANPEAGEREVLAIHQPHYPIQEIVRGIYDPASDEEATNRVRPEVAEECDRCDNPLPADEFALQVFDPDGDHIWMHEACYKEWHGEVLSKSAFYLVVNGHSHHHGPYGPHRAFLEN